MPRSFVHEARRRVGPKRERIRPIIDLLAVEHADARIALTFRNELELLVSVMLSAQTTDVNVNRVTQHLFEKYRRPEDYLAVPQEELERDVYATGFFRQKAKSLRGTMRVLLEEFDGRVPRTIPELLRLPGVARKTANVVAAELGNPQGVVVDTHVRRLSQRLGLTKQEDPVKIERDLAKLVPRADWGRFPHLLIWHGRRICDARRPLCEECVLAGLCPSSRIEVVQKGCLARRQRDEQAAVVVVGREDVRGDGLDLACARAELDLLAEPPHAPFERERDRALALLEAGEAERVDHVLAHQIAFAVARQLEDAAAGGEDARSAVAGDEPGVRRRVVVVEQLEEEAETAALTGDGLVQQALAAVVVERAVLAVRADEERHRFQRTERAIVC